MRDRSRTSRLNGPGATTRVLSTSSRENDMRLLGTRIASVTFVTLAMLGCGEPEATTTNPQSQQQASRPITLKCNVTRVTHDTGTLATDTPRSSSTSEFYRIEAHDQSVLFWDDKAAKFIPVCNGMKCTTSVSKSQIEWTRQMKDDDPLMLYNERTSISRATGEITGTVSMVIYHNMVAIRNSTSTDSGKCEKTSFDGKRLKF
jgi:hypothetical protein